MNNDEEKGLVEKKPNIFKRIFYFLFIDSSIEDVDEDEIEIEEITIENSKEESNTEEELEEVDDISDYTEEDIINLQNDFEAGEADLGLLTENQVNLLFSLYMDQINELNKSNEEKRQSLLKYKDNMKG